MSGDDIGAYITLAIWGLGFLVLVRALGLARALGLIVLLFLIASRIVFGFVGATRNR